MRIIDDARICLIFFTRLPVTWPEDLPRERITRAFQAAPVVGLVTGFIGALAYGLGMWLFDGSVHIAATLAVAAQVLTTGVFHEDGFADFFDGIGGGKSISERLEIMRDSRIGTFGGTALLLALILKIFLIAEIAQSWQAGLCLIISGTMGRTALVHVMTLLRPASEDGISASAGQPTPSEATTATIIGATISGVAVLLAFQFSFIGPAFGTVLGTILGAGTIALAARKYLGGQTGDALGACATTAELGALAGLVALIPGFGA
ncbi:adenosylcobinamide-GDP ribazoletransferase [Candidatus Phycosocius spiralis]|uniref:Adenosylcobinamide-GDP ribazoletransferase n=1 Tax=Candidatus Phycosocius spiralis TaxID=2815099 RepID=A0ABQ4PYH7_9PROT|nr:adenosylcobinamide-GDP ribazoletransferase [Candidatus Phycosocius spiralis]GIU67970.1 adenosylcobinamide-GDP ribazoletransferase [Candidatus Phycosocius spiralis]